MKYPCMFAFGLAMALATTPAMAMKVTNLDDVTHQVAFTAAGSTKLVTLAPGETENFLGQPAGKLSLVSAAKPSRGTGVVQADGLLSGIIGNGRTEGIPADSLDIFVIWPDGRLGIQGRIKDRGRR